MSRSRNRTTDPSRYGDGDTLSAVESDAAANSDKPDESAPESDESAPAAPVAPDDDNHIPTVDPRGRLYVGTMKGQGEVMFSLPCARWPDAVRQARKLLSMGFGKDGAPKVYIMDDGGKVYWQQK